jgi:hypothetical protein
MPYDLIHLAMRDAARRFGGTDGVFNAAGFGIAMMHMAGLNGGMDGHLVRAVLCGRHDVAILHGGAHFRILEEKP